MQKTAESSRIGAGEPAAAPSPEGAAVLPGRPPITLSPRERECLVLAFQGMTARETGQRLRCSERTVNYHLANAMGKLKVDNKLAAIQRACWIGAL